MIILMNVNAGFQTPSLFHVLILLLLPLDTDCLRDTIAQLKN